VQAQELPNVLAYPLEEAVSILKKAGITYALHQTSSPKIQAQTAKFRVVRQRFQREQGFLQLTVMPEVW